MQALKYLEIAETVAAVQVALKGELVKETEALKAQVKALEGAKSFEAREAEFAKKQKEYDNALIALRDEAKRVEGVKELLKAKEAALNEVEKQQKALDAKTAEAHRQEVAKLAAEQASFDASKRAQATAAAKREQEFFAREDAIRLRESAVAAKEEKIRSASAAVASALR